MATRKTGSSSRKSSTKKAPAAPKKTTTTTVKTVAAASTPSKKSTSANWTDNLANILVAELVGTFILTTVALLSIQLVSPLYVGIALTLIAFATFAISGSHVNPAVTFGLWSVRKLKTVLVPFYWIAQLLGALASLVVIDLVSGAKLNLDLSHFSSFSWSIFGVEMIGTAVFLFCLVAVVSRTDLKLGSKAFGVGLSLTVGLVVASSILSQVMTNVDQTKIKADQATGTLTNVPHELRVGGPILNPAIALATTEKTDTQLSGGSAGKTESQYSRFSWEVILGALLGAAVGGNLYLLISSRSREQ